MIVLEGPNLLALCLQLKANAEKAGLSCKVS